MGSMKMASAESSGCPPFGTTFSMAAARSLLEAGVPPNTIIEVPEERTYVQVRGEILLFFISEVFIP
jgi:hypothetical protein